MLRNHISTNVGFEQESLLQFNESHNNKPVRLDYGLVFILEYFTSYIETGDGFKTMCIPFCQLEMHARKLNRRF